MASLSVSADSPMGLADRVSRAEERWGGLDAAVRGLERLANEVDEPSDPSSRDRAEIVLWLTSWFVDQLEESLARRLGCLRRTYELLGDDHAETEVARLEVFDAFRVFWVWREALDAAGAAKDAAPGTGDDAASAAVKAVVQTVHDLDPLMVAWIAKKVPDAGVRTELLTALAGRLLVSRAGGDTGIRVHPSQLPALRADASELGMELQTVLREQLPGAVLCALGADDTLPDLRTIRSRAMKIAAPRDPRPGPRQDDPQPYLMAPSSKAPRTGLGDIGLLANSLADAAITPPSTENMALESLAVEDLVAELLAVSPPLTPRQREILALQLASARSGGRAPTSEEIGAALGVAPSTIRVQLSRMRSTLAAVAKARQ